MKTKMQKYKNIRNWARGCETEKTGVRSKQAKPSPRLHLLPPDFVQRARARFKMDILHTSSIAKTHNIKVVELSKRIQPYKKVVLTLKDQREFLWP